MQAMTSTLTVALLSELFAPPRGGASAPRVPPVAADAEARLRQRLIEARKLGAQLVVLPELPLNAWPAASRTPRDEDAEAPGGPRHAVMSRAAAAAEVGLLGGAIVRDPASGRRRNVALLFDARGALVLSYAKLHLPEEEGFWESSHYDPGDEPPHVTEAFGMPAGVQICSDVNRPQGSHLLGARGAEVLLCPRATESGTWERWKIVLRANAMTSAAYVLTVNRPGPEDGVTLGGPSMAVSPQGEVLAETLDPLSVVTLRRDVVARARASYPGYLKVRADLYARGWKECEGAPRQEKTP